MKVLSIPIALCTFFFIFSPSCKKHDDCTGPGNPDCPNYAPCLDETETNAGFDFYFRSYSGYGDTVYWLKMYDTLYVSTFNGGKI